MTKEYTFSALIMHASLWRKLLASSLNSWDVSPSLNIMISFGYFTVFLLCCVSCVQVAVSGLQQQQQQHLKTTNSLGTTAFDRYKEATHRPERIDNMYKVGKDLSEIGLTDELPSSDPTSPPPSSMPSSSMPSSSMPSSSMPSSLPSSIPSLMPSLMPSSMPSSMSSSMPSTRPSSMPSSMPPSMPSSLPSSIPSRQPSSQPSTDPTAFPFQQSSEQPTSSPSGKPTSQPSLQPSNAPSDQRISDPTSQPTMQPSSTPTCSPSADPTSQPSRKPSSQPTSMPSFSPSSMPSPAGSLAVNWWYMVSARCDVVAQNFYSYSDDEIFQSVVSTFAFVLTDPLNDVERETVEVSAEPITSSSVEMMSLERNMQVLPKAEEGSSSWAVHWSAHTNAVVLQNKRADKMRVSRGLSTDNRAYLIEAWCPDHPTALKVYQAMERVELDSRLKITEPLRENGLRDVTNATVSNVALSTTTDLPPSFLEEDLSPERITWIIVGTIVVFAVALFLLSRLKYVKYLYCTKTCVEDVMRSWYNTLADGCMMCLRSVGLVSSDLHLYYGSGFDLTTQEEEADFYGENRSNLPSDNLDIHYGGKNNANLRSTYLEDDEDGGGLGQNGKKANSRSGFGGLFGDRGKGSKGGPQVPRTPPSRRSPDSHTIELSTIHHNFSSSSSRNESTVRSPMTAGYTVSGVNSFGVVHNSRLPTDMYRPVGDDIDDIGDFSPIVSAGNSTHNNNNSCSNNNNMYDSTDYESYVV